MNNLFLNEQLLSGKLPGKEGSIQTGALSFHRTTVADLSCSIASSFYKGISLGLTLTLSLRIVPVKL